MNKIKLKRLPTQCITHKYINTHKKRLNTGTKAFKHDSSKLYKGCVVKNLLNVLLNSSVFSKFFVLLCQT